ncbi:enamine deaminase RidA (YjgF/YER057c/UK114 family) [Deinobacterium chartae]|uniref:Enamine deaminase RidA (YjgF/YER057c/UK114 family) n=1 Tax=Deinobacterium chartae TaxID=521158 RepID=A0A841I4C5_9DEIO|nr:RidA family protein [Deinobacterium chartae]MBB6099149.1 enamine deaminase RidA (YjgF/YER057c/UK114 family) [Deinobacterium chartae]
MTSQNPHLRFVNPPALGQAPGYTHVVEASGGRSVYISGQVALDGQGQVVGPGDWTAQTERVFENLRTALESVGLDFGSVVKLTLFLTDFDHISAVREVRDRYVNTAAPPASSAVQVVRLFRPELLIEVEAVAVAPA